MLIDLSIPVKPVVKKYLENKLGTPLALTQNSNIGRYLLCLLRGQENKNEARYTAQLYKFSESITLQVHEHAVFKRKCRFMTPKAIYDFNDFINTEINEDFCAFAEVIKTMGQGWTMNEIADAFLERQNLTCEDIKHDRLIKAFQRHRDREEGKEEQKMTVSIKNNLPNCPEPAAPAVSCVAA